MNHLPWHQDPQKKLGFKCLAQFLKVNGSRSPSVFWTHNNVIFELSVHSLTSNLYDFMFKCCYDFEVLNNSIKMIFLSSGSHWSCSVNIFCLSAFHCCHQLTSVDSAVHKSCGVSGVVARLKKEAKQRGTQVGFDKDCIEQKRQKLHSTSETTALLNTYIHTFIVRKIL